MWMNSQASHASEPGEPQPADQRDRAPPADRRERALVAVAERRRAAPPRRARTDVRRRVRAHLDRGRRDAGDRLPVLLERGEVADHEDLAAARAPSGRGSTRTRPARSSGAPRERRERRGRDARPPTPRSGRRCARSPIADAAARRRRSRARRSRPRTPSASSCASPSPRAPGYVGSTRGPASTRMTRAVRGSMRRKSRASVWRAISANVAGHLDAGRPAADDHEREPLAARPRRRSSRSAASKATQHAPADLERVLEGLQPRRVRLPLVAARSTSGSPRPRRRGSRRRARRRRGGRASRPASIAVTSASSTRALRLAAQDAPDRRGDLGGRQPGGRHLVEQRLEQVVVRAVDQRHVDGRPREAARRGEPAKPPPTITTRGRASMLSIVGRFSALADEPAAVGHDRQERGGRGRGQPAGLHPGRGRRPPAAVVESRLACPSRSERGTTGRAPGP